MPNCPCGSQFDYEKCCGLLIEQGVVAKTPEALMRSRYCAYTQANIGYIQRTMRGKASIGFNAREAKQWAQRVVWTGLRVIATRMDGFERGTVEFKATFNDSGKQQSIHEVSEFQRQDGVWFYVDGRQHTGFSHR